MSCGCLQMRKERSEYDNIKKLARAWAKNENEIVFIYKNEDGTYGFMPLDCPEAKEKEAIEFISPLL